MLKEYPVDPKIRKIWKKYPLRLSSGLKSDCCRMLTVLVQSMEGGFVPQNCPSCGQFRYLSWETFRHQLDLWVACPTCKKAMEPDRLPDQNYGHVCGQCNLCIPLAALLPRWQDIR